MFRRLLSRASPGTAVRREGFELRTPIAKAVGDGGRYACDTVRALPGGREKGVVLQASDGRQAVCLLTTGSLSAPQLVPAEVLPTRQLKSDVVIERVNDEWRSSEGRLAAADPEKRPSFPPIADVLPRCDQPPDAADQPIAVAVDLALLKKVADALGTLKLTLLIQPPPEALPGPAPIPPGRQQVAAAPQNQETARKPRNLVTRPIAICPATDEAAVRGIGVVMPIQPSNAHEYFELVRQAVCRAERRAAAAPQEPEPASSPQAA
jgi:hypothetical protein